MSSQAVITFNPATRTGAVHTTLTGGRVDKVVSRYCAHGNWTYRVQVLASDRPPVEVPPAVLRVLCDPNKVGITVFGAAVEEVPLKLREHAQRLLTN